MYQENQFRTFNIWRDGDILHVFLTVPAKKYEQYKETIDYVKSILDEIPFLYKCTQIYLYRWAHCSIVKTRSQREKIFGCMSISLLSQKFLSFFVDFGATPNSYIVCPFSLCYFGPADKGKINTIGVKEICTKKINLELLTFGEIKIYFIFLSLFPLKNMHNIRKLSNM